MDALPLIFTAPLVFLFGIVIGSFANVVICRLHTGKSLNNRSHCLSCGRTLSWYDLVPVLSYAVLRGRCRTCGAWIPGRYVAVELLTGLSFVAVFFTAADSVLMVLTFAVVTLLIIGAVYDMYHLIIPDEIVILTGIVAGSAALYESYMRADIMHFVWALGAGALAFLFYAGLWYISGGRWIGFGDAKLAIPLAMLVGISGIFSLIVFSFWVGAAVSVCLLAIQELFRGGQEHLPFSGGRLKMKSEIPFAPFLIIAFALVFFLEADVLALTTYVFNY